MSELELYNELEIRDNKIRKIELEPPREKRQMRLLHLHNVAEHIYRRPPYQRCSITHASLLRLLAIASVQDLCALLPVSLPNGQLKGLEILEVL